MEDIKVKKRDGNLEPWSFDKLVTSINKAGVEIKEAEEIAKEVENWALNNIEEGAILSTNIRDKVTETLRKEHPAEADTYQAFKKE